MNRNLLLNTQLRLIMTYREQKDEADTNMILPYYATRNFFEINDTTPTLEPMYLLPPLQPLSRTNLQSVISAYRLDAIFQTQDLMDVRNHIRKKSDKEESVSNKLKAIKN